MCCKEKQLILCCTATLLVFLIIFFDLLNIYSVIPGYLFCKKCFLDIGPLIIISPILLFNKVLLQFLKQFEI